MNPLDLIVLAMQVTGRLLIASDLRHGMEATNRAVRACLEHRYLAGAVRP